MNLTILILIEATFLCCPKSLISWIHFIYLTMPSGLLAFQEGRISLWIPSMEILFGGFFKKKKRRDFLVFLDSLGQVGTPCCWGPVKPSGTFLCMWWDCQNELHFTFFCFCGKALSPWTVLNSCNFSSSCWYHRHKVDLTRISSDASVQHKFVGTEVVYDITITVMLKKVKTDIFIIIHIW